MRVPFSRILLLLLGMALVPAGPAVPQASAGHGGGVLVPVGEYQTMLTGPSPWGRWTGGSLRIHLGEGEALLEGRLSHGAATPLPGRRSTYWRLLRGVAALAGTRTRPAGGEVVVSRGPGRWAGPQNGGGVHEGLQDEEGVTQFSYRPSSPDEGGSLRFQMHLAVERSGRWYRTHFEVPVIPGLRLQALPMAGADGREVEILHSSGQALSQVLTPAGEDFRLAGGAVTVQWLARGEEARPGGAVRILDWSGCHTVEGSALESLLAIRLEVEESPLRALDLLWKGGKGPPADAIHLEAPVGARVETVPPSSGGLRVVLADAAIGEMTLRLRHRRTTAEPRPEKVLLPSVEVEGALAVGAGTVTLHGAVPFAVEAEKAARGRLDLLVGPAAQRAERASPCPRVETSPLRAAWNVPHPLEGGLPVTLKWPDPDAVAREPVPPLAEVHVQSLVRPGDPSVHRLRVPGVGRVGTTIAVTSVSDEGRVMELFEPSDEMSEEDAVAASGKTSLTLTLPPAPPFERSGPHECRVVALARESPVPGGPFGVLEVSLPALGRRTERLFWTVEAPPGVMLWIPPGGAGSLLHEGRSRQITAVGLGRRVALALLGGLIWLGLPCLTLLFLASSLRRVAPADAFAQIVMGGALLVFVAVLAGLLHGLLTPFLGALDLEHDRTVAARSAAGRPEIFPSQVPPSPSRAGEESVRASAGSGAASERVYHGMPLRSAGGGFPLEDEGVSTIEMARIGLPPKASLGRARLRFVQRAYLPLLQMAGAVLGAALALAATAWMLNLATGALMGPVTLLALLLGVWVQRLMPPGEGVFPETVALVWLGTLMYRCVTTWPPLAKLAGPLLGQDPGGSTCYPDREMEVDLGDLFPDADGIEFVTAAPGASGEGDGRDEDGAEPPVLADSPGGIAVEEEAIEAGRPGTDSLQGAAPEEARSAAAGGPLMSEAEEEPS